MFLVLQEQRPKGLASGNAITTVAAMESVVVLVAACIGEWAANKDSGKGERKREEEDKVEIQSCYFSVSL